jgi:hypothetical protein
VFPRPAPIIGLVAALAGLPLTAHAQVNIDQGKPAAQIFANDCAACHKATRGLASGKNSLTLSLFLREHYTASREQAAALAAYVLGAGGAESAAQKPGQKPGQKPVEEHAKVEEPKTGARPAIKPEGEAPATAKLQPPVGEEAKPEEHPAPGTEPAAVPVERSAVSHEERPVTATRGRKKEPEAASPAPLPGAVATAPLSTETPGADQSPTTSAAVPTERLPGEGEPVPRDNIPD